MRVTKNILNEGVDAEMILQSPIEAPEGRSILKLVITPSDFKGWDQGPEPGIAQYQPLSRALIVY